MNAASSILIVEDDKKTCEILSLYLKREGYETLIAHSGRSALDLAAQHMPVFAILDLMLPDLDGWEICRRFREGFGFPILILSALGTTPERIRGFAVGADDYVVKPFSPKELVARVNAIMRRVKPEPMRENTFSHGDLVLDAYRQQVTLRGREIALTPSEYRLLKALIAVPGRIASRPELLRSLYPAGGVVVDRVIDVHIGCLRQKIEADAAKPRYILTARGIGYRFADNAGTKIAADLE